MIHVAICDDNIADLERLRDMLLKSRNNLQIVSYDNGEALIKELKTGSISFSLYYLDIYMDGINGVETAQQIRAIDQRGIIIFVSTSEDFYRAAYDVFAFNYLLKPLQSTAFNTVLENALIQLKQEQECIIRFTYRGREYCLHESEILYISSENHNVIFHMTNNETYLYYGKLENLLPQLRHNLFVRCHQSFVVNLSKVMSLDIGNFRLGNLLIPVSRRYGNEVKKRYQEYLFETFEQ